MSKKQISWAFLLFFCLTLVLATKLTPTYSEITQTKKQNTNYSPLNLPIAFASSKPFIQGLAVEKAEVEPQIKAAKDQLPIQDIKLTLTNDKSILRNINTTSSQPIKEIVVGKSNSQIADEQRLAEQKAEAEKQARLAYLNSLREKPYMSLIMKWFPEAEWGNAYYVMSHESGGNPNATSYAGARGLFQIMPMHAWRCGYCSLYDPEANVRVARDIWSEQGWYEPWLKNWSNTNTVRYASPGSIKKLVPSNEQCVGYVARKKGIRFGVMYASQIRPNTFTPRVGEAALHTYNHVSLVVGVGSGYIVVREANYVKNWIIERVVPLSEIRGYVI